MTSDRTEMLLILATPLAPDGSGRSDAERYADRLIAAGFERPNRTIGSLDGVSGS